MIYIIWFHLVRILGDQLPNILSFLAGRHGKAWFFMLGARYKLERFALGLMCILDIWGRVWHGGRVCFTADEPLNETLLPARSRECFDRFCDNLVRGSCVRRLWCGWPPIRWILFSAHCFSTFAHWSQEVEYLYDTQLVERIFIILCLELNDLLQNP